ncbi:MAG: hypothetical protein FRX49_04669 [Trebouxia sp. A1-2]|nr:MAG: hypothetical protein FRX49_04669 [Trebouxia sp. A1-2]
MTQPFHVTSTKHNRQQGHSTAQRGLKIAQTHTCIVKGPWGRGAWGGCQPRLPQLLLHPDLYGAAILVAHKATEAGPQRGVALGLHPSLLDDCCQLIIFLQRHVSQVRQEDEEKYRQELTKR